MGVSQDKEETTIRVGGRTAVGGRENGRESSGRWWYEAGGRRRCIGRVELRII